MHLPLLYPCSFIILFLSFISTSPISPTIDQGFSYSAVLAIGYSMTHTMHWPLLLLDQAALFYRYLHVDNCHAVRQQRSCGHSGSCCHAPESTETRRLGMVPGRDGGLSYCPSSTGSARYIRMAQGIDSDSLNCHTFILSFTQQF